MALVPEPGRVDAYGPAGQTRESSASAVAWPAIIGGAFVAAAVSILLFALGSGIGLASIFPWTARSNPSPTTFTAAAAIWLIIVQWVSAGLGGYLTGRLRTKWVDAHTHDVFFRDTANGFLTWAVATVVVVSLVASSAASLAGGGTRAATTVAAGTLGGMAQGAAQTAGQSSSPTGYFIDSLFRPAQLNANAPAAEARSEAEHMLARSVMTGSIEPADRTYLAQLVAARTGISQADAEKRVDDVLAKVNAAEEKAKQVANRARKAAASFSFFTFFSMLIGAFIACVAAALGGRERDAI
ncbi:MAG: hypothetical protein JO069_04305 [Verrucomicrobia bacterium]|nr:hypothetical protein [Verrucomicrobiota bacterium]